MARKLQVELKKLITQEQEIRTALQRLEKEATSVAKELDDALLADGETATLHEQAQTINQKRQDLQRRLTLIEARLTELRPVAIEEEIAEIDKMIGEQATHKKQGWETFEKAKDIFRQAESEWLTVASNRGLAIDRLRKQRGVLEDELAELTSEEVE